MRHVLSALVQNVPGVLAHVAGMFASRGYNIDSLAVGETEDPGLSRMTFVVVGDDSVLEQVRKQLEKIVTVVRVDDITVSPAGADLPSEQVVVLDRAQSSVTPVTLSDGNLGPALRAGNGATTTTVDRYGRVLVANTRDDELIGFFGSPLVMRFRYPVADGPYAVDYDDTHNLAWVSPTANNEVVAYDLSGGEPVEKHRFPTIAQPDSIAVDDRTGTVYLLSPRGGLQVAPPDYTLRGVVAVAPTGGRP